MKKVNQFIFLLFIILTFTKCNFVFHANHNLSEDSNELEKKYEDKNSYLQKYFSNIEKQNLYKIVEEVDKVILSKNIYIDIDSAYHYFLDSIYLHIDEVLLLNEKDKYLLIFNLDTSLFDKIWSKTIPKIVRTRDTTLYNPPNYYTIDLNYDGEFLNLVKDFGRTNKYYKEYYQSIKASGGFSPTVFAGFLHNNHKFDFNDWKNRLFASILLLTLEESTEKKVKMYLQQN